MVFLCLVSDRGNDNWLIKYEQATTQGNGGTGEKEVIITVTFYVFFMIFQSESEFLFPSLDSESLQKEGLVLMERICSIGANSFLEELILVRREAKMKMAELLQSMSP